MQCSNTEVTISVFAPFFFSFEGMCNNFFWTARKSPWYPLFVGETCAAKHNLMC